MRMGSLQKSIVVSIGLTTRNRRNESEFPGLAHRRIQGMIFTVDRHREMAEAVEHGDVVDTTATPTVTAAGVA